VTNSPTLTPRISVIIPAYNTARFLQAAVDSVVGQTFREWEVVIVDDGSTDETGAIADEYAKNDPRIRVIHQRNGGLSQARNAGIREAAQDSSYVLFLDGDDMVCADTLEFLMAHLEQQPDAVAVYGLPMSVTENGQPLTPNIEAAFGYRRRGIRGGRLVEWPCDGDTGIEILSIWTCIETSGQILLRRKAMNGLWFDPEVDGSKNLGSEDWDYWFRLSLRGRIIHTNRFVLQKRVHEASITRTWRRNTRSGPVMRRKWLVLPEAATPRVRKLIQQGHRESAFRRIEWAQSQIRRGDFTGAVRNLGSFVREYAGYMSMRDEYRTAWTSGGVS
jgi:glycosyltransferase involved in cell wall biosynthesis